jgi:acyl-CoA synthetase (NDP forming)
MKAPETTLMEGSTQNPSIKRLLSPASVAIVGASATPGSLGDCVLTNLERADFAGALYLINPKRAEVRGRPCLPSVDDLPPGIDCAVLAIPRAGVLDAVSACARRGVGSIIVFSAGFAESGPEGRADQEEIARIAQRHGILVEGPNCLGMVNYIEGTPLTFVLTPPARFASQSGIAVVSQSGAMAAVLGVSLRAHGLDLTYSVSTGNEAATALEDFAEHLIEDASTRVIAMIAEQIRNPARFLKVARRARELDKYLVLMHPGSSSAARLSAQTHTGAMAGDYEVMRTKVTHDGVLLVDTLEELADVSELLMRFKSLPREGAAVLTESGAFKAISLDFCERIGLALPALSNQTENTLRQVLPPFIPPTNPLDITAHALVDPTLYRSTLPPILADEGLGSLVLAIILTDHETSALKFPPILEAIRELKTAKPIVFAGLDEGAQFSFHFVEQLRALGVPFFPSPERAFRALAHVTRFGAQQKRRVEPVPELAAPLLSLSPGVMPEFKSKRVLAAAGIPIPAGALAQTVEEAQAIAARIGFPVVLKAQSARLSHKSDAGGVVLNLATPEALDDGWKKLHQAVGLHIPGLALDGVLVEQMGRPGAELIVGARNDPQWGPVLLVGFGGVFAEALQDRRLLPPDLGIEDVIEEMNKLKGAAILRGFRGSQALDVRAAAQVVFRLGALMRSNGASIIEEVDINPVVVYPAGQGAVALDALIITR